MAALYVHVPFREPPLSSDAATFVGALTCEMAQYARPPFAASSFRTLYVGGGRPSLLPLPTLRTIVENAREKLGAAAIEEATLELHPSDVSPSVLAALHQLGFTRLSIDARPLTGGELHSLLHQTQHAGFEQVSVDLFFGGTEHSLATWKARLHQAVDLRVSHIALHERGPTGDEDEPERADQFAFAMTFLGAKGYEQYELTHFARPRHRSCYQAHVYAHGNVLGVGPGAESFWWPDRSDPSTARRWSNVADEATYRKRLRDEESPVAQRETPSRPALAREYLLLSLRTNAGLDLNVLADRYGESLRNCRTLLNRLAAEGLLRNDPGRIRLTNRGRLLTDAITQRLIREI